MSFDGATYVETQPLTQEQRNCLAVAQAIREESCIRFDMSRIKSSCGTVGCIAGTTIVLLDNQFWQRIGGVYGMPWQKWSARAQHLLGLTHRQAYSLFFSHYEATKDQAADTLERFARTGKVEWL